MKKLIGSLFGLLVLATLAIPAHATSSVVSPKASAELTYTTTASTITVGPSAIYEVTLATGASGEYVAFFDTNTASTGGVAVTSNTASVASGFKTRLYFGSTTANTQIKFDPPLIFYYGIQVVDSAATGQSVITYEEGRGLSGQ